VLKSLLSTRAGEFLTQAGANLKEAAKLASDTVADISSTLKATVTPEAAEALLTQFKTAAQELKEKGQGEATAALTKTLLEAGWDEARIQNALMSMRETGQATAEMATTIAKHVSDNFQLKASQISDTASAKATDVVSSLLQKIGPKE
jgi:phage tail sheath gpL-like